MSQVASAGVSARVLVLLVCVSVLAACRAEAAVDVTVRADGSGKVTVAVGLDDEAVERVGDLDKELHSEDLVAAGWVVSKPVKRGELTWVAASKPFHSPTDLQRVVGEVGVFEGFGVDVEDGFGRTTWTVKGKVHLTGSLEQFTDSDLAAAIDGLPLGRTPEELAKELGEHPGIPLRVSVRMPSEPDGPSSWTFSANDGRVVDQRISTTSSKVSSVPLRWFLGGAIALLLAAVLAVVMRLRARRV